MNLKKIFRKNKLFRKIDNDGKGMRKVGVFIAIFLVLASLSIGFAYLSLNLNIGGNAVISSDVGVTITNVTYTSTNGGYIGYNPIKVNTYLSTSTILPNLDSTVTYAVTFKNYDDATRSLQRIVSSRNIDEIEYTISDFQIGNSILGEESVTVHIEMHYAADITTPTLIASETSINFQFDLADAVNYEYVTSGLSLNLRGIDSPLSVNSSNDTWEDDTANSNRFTLNNVGYDSFLLGYDFKSTLNSNAVGTQAYIPATGDFTLELYISTTSSFGTTEDQSIISQVNASSYDAGRFKVEIEKASGGNPYIGLFVNRTYNSLGSITYNMKDNILTSTRYQIQAVRKNGVLHFYVDGVEATSASFDGANSISQSITKLGMFNNNSNQYFTGMIFAVRVYNRALETSELTNNMCADFQKYHNNNTINNIKNFCISNYLVTAGSGVYDVGAGRYVFKGPNPSNYVTIGTNSFRIISFEADSSMKLIQTTDNIDDEIVDLDLIAFDDANNRAVSTYCVDPSKGCNIWANNSTVLNNSTLFTYLNTNYYNNMDLITANLQSNVLEKSFYTGAVVLNSTPDDAITAAKTETYNSYIGLLSAVEILEASGSSIGLESTNRTNYLIKLAASNDFAWTLTPSASNDYDVYMLVQGSLVTKRRASRTFQCKDNTETCTGDVKIAFHAYPVFSVSSNKLVNGYGTSINPFVLTY